MSMLVPPDLAAAGTSSDGVAHGIEGTRKPEQSHIQAVLDRLSPEPTTARNMRWSSVFRISHRIVNSYGTPGGSGRAFVAGDAAHIHPPTGAQGMNTGIQDAHNLAWKLALAVRDEAADGLLDSYDAERRPVGEEVVGRTVRSAREGIGADTSDPDYLLRREAQLLISYAGSPIVADGAGERAPDAKGLGRLAVTDPVRLFSLLTRRDHTVLLYAGSDTGPDAVLAFEATASAVASAAHGRADVYVIAPPGADVGPTTLPVIVDANGDFARNYSANALSVFVLRPDGYLGYAARDVRAESMAGPIVSHLRSTFR